jgi:hypothetical protein
VHPALGNETAELLAPLPQILDLLRVLPGVVVRSDALFDVLVLDGKLQAVSELLQLLLGELLLLVGHVPSCHRLQAPALHRLGQDHHRRALELHGPRVRRVELAVVVAATAQAPDVVVGEMGHHLLEPGVRAEEVLTDIGAGLDGVLLELSVQGGVHLVHQQPVDVLG